MDALLLAAQALGQGNAVVKVTPGDDGSLTVTTTQMLNRQQAADYLGMGLKAFLALKIARRGNGHKPYHMQELDEYLNLQKIIINEAKAKTL